MAALNSAIFSPMKKKKKKNVFVPADLGNILKGKWVRVVPVTGNNTAHCSVIYISINKKLKCTCFVSTLL